MTLQKKTAVELVDNGEGIVDTVFVKLPYKLPEGKVLKEKALDDIQREVFQELLDSGVITLTVKEVSDE